MARTISASLAVLCAGVLATSGCGDDGGRSQDAMSADAMCCVDHDAMPVDPSYAAYNLFTGAPRFAIFKADAARDLCVRVVFIWVGPEQTVDLEVALPAESVSVTNRVADCSSVDGTMPPSLETPGVSAQSVTGTATVRRYPDGDTDRWTVSIDGVITFLPEETWVPETEPVVADEMEIVGGCC